MDQITISKEEFTRTLFDALNAEMTDDAIKDAPAMLKALVMVTGMEMFTHIINSLFSAEAEADQD